MNLCCKKKAKPAILFYLRLVFISTDTVFIVVWTLGGKQLPEAEKHEKVELSKFILIIDLVEMKFWNSLLVEAIGQEGAYSSWIMARECKMW